MTLPDDDTLFSALRARDTRFDGVFFVGISTTGIYCRPICPARSARRTSCHFFPSAAAAERAGFRPCLRCRPELAPGRAPVDSVSRLAHAAATRIEDGALENGSLEDLAAELGVSDRHLRRATESAFGVAPVELAQTHRLLLAKRLLTDTALPVMEVALASGFRSLRRFNALFRERYRLTPTAIRRSLPEAQREAGAPLVCHLAYRPPLAWAELLAFLADRAVRGVERVEAGRYLRTAEISGHQGWLSVSPAREGRAALRVEISSSLSPVVGSVLTRVRRLFDLSAAPESIARQLGPLAETHPGLRVPGAFHGFEIAVLVILGQDVTVAAATTLARRFALAFGAKIETPHAALDRLTAQPARVARAPLGDIAALGIARPAAAALLALARAMAQGELVLAPGHDPDATVARLRQLPGVSSGTAQSIVMRTLAWPDAFPETDLPLCHAAGNLGTAEWRARAESWRPWRSYAVLHLCQSVPGSTAANSPEPTSLVAGPAPVLVAASSRMIA